MTEIRTATAADADVLVPLLAAAFAEGALADWLVPDPADRPRINEAYFADAFRYEVEGGKVYTNDALTGVAFWSHRVDAQELPAERKEALHQLTGPYAERFCWLEQAFADRHPTPSHHYLAFLAVAPEQQGKGIGAALLKAYHTQHLDPRGLPAYLEATNPRNRALYRQHGYVDGPELVLPDGGPALYPMWRGKHLPTGWHEARRAAPSAG